MLKKVIGGGKVFHYFSKTWKLCHGLKDQVNKCVVLVSRRQVWEPQSNVWID